MRAGKRWRPFLTASVVQSLVETSQDGWSEDLKRICVAVECFHKASLIHDDIEDEDDQRYGEQTLHASHGVAVALNVGDLLVGEECPTDRCDRAFSGTEGCDASGGCRRASPAMPRTGSGALLDAGSTPHETSGSAGNFSK